MVVCFRCLNKDMLFEDANRQVSSRRELHLPDSRMCQQFLPILPEELLLHLWFEFDLDRIEVLHPALRRDEGIIRAKKKAILEALLAELQAVLA